MPIDFEDPKATLQLLDGLEALGLDNDRFRALHHAINYKNYISAHRRYCRNHQSRFQPGDTNVRTARRLAVALDRRRAGADWSVAIAAALQEVPLDAMIGATQVAQRGPDAQASSRSPLRSLVWGLMERLEDAGLGKREVVSDQRDKFLLDPAHPSVAHVSTRPHADGFIRSDRGSLLFRDANPTLVDAVAARLTARRMQSSKGLEFRWSALDEDAIGGLFRSVEAVAFAPIHDEAELESVRRQLAVLQPPRRPPEGQKHPLRVKTMSVQFARSPHVIDQVLREAGGHCEHCRAPAPFFRTDGTPFLEVHHVCRLADGGSDRATNAVAVCPNCHRLLHHSPDAAAAVERLFSSVGRLVAENVELTNGGTTKRMPHVQEDASRGNIPGQRNLST